MKRKAVTLADWLRFIESRIAAHTTPPRTSGKYKGHGSTESLKWVAELAREVQADIRRRNPGIGYDENMAIAAELGLVLCAWYFNVHRAKTYSMHRPLKLRRKAAAALAERRKRMLDAMMNDELMASVWTGQAFNLPYGLGAADGTFV